MTTVYFIRHCKADNSERDGRIRPLTEKGTRDAALVTQYLQDKNIDAIVSSPFKRAIDTVAPFAESAGLEISIVEDFRERRSDSDWLRDEDFWPFVERQWADFSYSLSDGESLETVQKRNIAALNGVLAEHAGECVAIGTHGTALSTIVNYYDKTFGFKDFLAMVGIMPWAVVMEFEGTECRRIEKVDLFAESPK